MTDEAIILDTLKFIREHTVRMGKQFVNIRKTIWWNFNINKQDDLEEKILSRIFMALNSNNQNEVELTAQARTYIKEGDKPLEKDFLKSIQKQPDIEFFMVNHFIKPEPTSPSNTHETDNGVVFLKGLKGKGLINFDKDDLLHISNDWYEEDPPINKRWFDTVDKNHPFLVEITELGRNYLLLEEEIRPTPLPITQEIAQPIKRSHDGIGWFSELMIWIAKNIILVIIIGVIIGLLILITWYFTYPWFKHTYPKYDIP
jgi:hypothetical protein